jgi:transcriptional regulator with PAS, ATPase and Fis domain
MSNRIIGQSEALLRALEEARQIAGTDYSVIIQGESGTGKELIARYIHDNSKRAAGNFVAINIASYTGSLIDSELFGHEKGAFTGAINKRIGILELTGYGTLFLDEIGDLSRELQVKLLRVLQEREFYPLGSNKTIPLKARVLAATNVDLKKQVAEGRFREDLFYRLGQFIKMPPLRERKEDIPLLVDYLIQQEEPHMSYPEWFDAHYRQILYRIFYEYPYQWPGNIRGLQNVLRSVLLKCVCHGRPEMFEQQVIKTLQQHCDSDDKSLNQQLIRLISNVVRDHIVSYPTDNTSLRVRMNDILVEGIFHGLDLALNVDAFRPRTGKELGYILGIPALSNSNRSQLPRNDNDYIVKALKNIGCREELPEKVNELIAM